MQGMIKFSCEWEEEAQKVLMHEAISIKTSYILYCTAPYHTIHPSIHTYIQERPYQGSADPCYRKLVTAIRS